MELDRLLLLQRADDEEDIPRPDADAGDIVVLLGEIQDIDLGVVVEPNVIPPAEMDLDAALGRADPVALADGHIEGGLLVAEIGGSLDERLAFDEAQAGDRVVRIFRVLHLLGILRGRRLRRGFLRVDAGREQEKRGRDDECLLHGPSPIRTRIVQEVCQRPCLSARGKLSNLVLKKGRPF